MNSTAQSHDMQKGGAEKPARCKKWLCPASAHVSQKGKLKAEFFFPHYKARAFALSYQ